ncbi:MAG: hypothetical protein ACYC1M_01045 [Armatimonadota bacterium]
MRFARIVTVVLATTGLCCWQTNAQSQEVTPKMRALIAKTQSFGLTRFPISFWSYTNLKEHGKHMTEDEVKSWADAGFTVPQSPSFDPKVATQMSQMHKILGWAKKYDMKMVVCDPRGYAQKGSDGTPPKQYAEGIREAVADFGKDPAMFGFHIGDEPDAEMKNSFFECYRIQKQIAPNLHPYANLLPHFPGIEVRAGTDTWPNYLDEYAKKSNADLLGYDCYTQMNAGDTGWNDYYRNLRLYREAALRNGIPFWNTVLSVGHYKYRCPNQDDLRWQFNTSLAAGANGIVWFFYYMRQPHANYRMSPVDELWEKTQGYYDLRRIQTGFHRRYKDLFNHIASTRVSFVGKVYGGGEAFTPDRLVKQVECGKDAQMIVGEFTDLQSRPYVMFVNNSTTESEFFNVSFPKGTRTFSQDWSGNEYEGGAYCIGNIDTDSDGCPRHQLILAPGQEAFYRLELTK